MARWALACATASALAAAPAGAVARAGVRAERGTPLVGIVRCTFVDRSRSTEDYATGTVTPGRRLVTEIRYPSSRRLASGGESPGAPPAKGPLPLIVFAHGFAVTPDTYAALLDYWARAGFVVAAPLFPDTSGASAAGDDGADERDIANQPADVAFVIRSLRSAAAGASGTCPLLHGLLAHGEVEIAGQSDGGDTVAALAYDSTDAPLAAGLGLRAVEVLSGAENTTAGSYAAGAGAPPALFVQAEFDGCNPPQQAAALYSALGSRVAKWFVETTARSHLGPYSDRASVQFAAVAKATLRFFTAELSGDAPATVTAALREATAGSPAVAAVRSGDPPPPIAPVEPTASACAPS